MSLTDAITTLLAATSPPVAVAGTTLFVGATSTPPDGDGTYVTLVPYAGGAPMGTHNDGLTAYRQPACQVVCRDRESAVAEAKAVACYGVLTVTNQTIGGVWFRKLAPKQEPFELLPDAQGRSRWVFNLEAIHSG